MRTGNTPVSMAITDEQRYLIVGNDRSHLASVFDLETLQAQAPILFQDGYPRSIAAAHGGIWATVRVVSPPPSVTCSGGAANNPLYRIDFDSRMANAPSTLGVYCNQVPAQAVLASTPSENYILLAQPDGTVAMWDAGANSWVVSRTNGTAAGGAIGAFNDNLFIVDDNVLTAGLFPIAKLQSTTGSSSGVGVLGGAGLRTTAVSTSGPGTIERVDLNTLQPFHATSIAEAPLLAGTMNTPAAIGQIGQTILPFTRTMAVSADGSSIFVLSQSGITVLASNFDATTITPVVSGIVNGADGGTGIAPGGLALVHGNGLAPRSESAVGLPLPSTLGDACVTVGNIALPLFRVSPTEVLAQLPFGLTGDVPLVVRNPGGVSNPFTAHIQNLFDNHYQDAIGYPALGYNYRLGLRFTWGPER